MQKLLIALILAALPLAAQARNPNLQNVGKTVVIKATPDKVWAIVKDFGSIQYWHPAVASTQVEKKDGRTFRLITLKDGGTIHEGLISTDDSNMKMRYEIIEGVLPVSKYTAFMQVVAGPEAGESTVTWNGYFFRANYLKESPVPEKQAEKTAVDAITGVYDAGLDGLKKLAESK